MPHADNPDALLDVRERARQDVAAKYENRKGRAPARAGETRVEKVPTKVPRSSLLITELSEKESLDLLTRSCLARLACAKDGQPYIVPIFIVYQDGYVHSASTEGQKIEWLRANPLVCLEVDEVDSPQQWISVIVYGHYVELPDTPEWQSERQLTWWLLQQRPIWWEPAYAETIIHSEEKVLHPLYFRIQVERISGRRGKSSDGA